ncbi:hypothetical protein GRX03_01090 [Halovenus sp. WSH3]|uniref:Uncharacterized protein n=1 Tax=Halovenus carboxidivorans TaxID=2692199 RepID=A0A6B0T1V2_9EURY|nr:hypothetical protein [Halovenus carboxidivorans]MXR50206.1 hypothetical protein [Halovenus carboxidivorans]
MDDRTIKIVWLFVDLTLILLALNNIGVVTDSVVVNNIEIISGVGLVLALMSRYHHHIDD